MKKTPLISFIIAAHNCAGTLAAAVQSLFDAAGSDLSKIEIIIINDASRDATGEIIKSLAQRSAQIVPASVNFKNIGKVRQHGVTLSRGQYITMLDSDDLLKAGSLPSILEFLRHATPDMLLTSLHEIRDLTKINHRWSGLNAKKISRNETIKRFLIHKDLQAHLIGQFIKREIYLAHPIPAMTCYEDFYVFPEMLTCAKSIYFQRDSHYYYIKNKGSLSSTLNNEKITNLIICTEKMEKILPVHFRNLILCHWLDIYLKHAILLTGKDQQHKVKTRVNMTHSLNFFLTPSVRFSYKRKALSTLWKN